jgi:hypothetical protein
MTVTKDHDFVIYSCLGIVFGSDRRIGPANMAASATTIESGIFPRFLTTEVQLARVAVALVV